MKKVKYLIITCLSIVLLSYGVIAFANGGTSADSDNILREAVTGKFIALEDGNRKIKVSLEAGIKTYPLDKSTWVLRDKEKATLENLKSGDKIEFVFNSSNKVAYIKAYSEVYLKAEAAALSASPIPTLAPIATVKPEPSPTATPKVNKPIIKVNDDNQAIAAKQEDKNEVDCDDKHDSKDNDNEDHDGKGNDHHDGKDNKHHGRNNHDMKKND
jgi:Cu/Ag efflux protein CusF